MKFFSKYVVLLKGGIGNQLFQYSYAKYLQSVEHKSTVVYYYLPGDPYNRENIINGVDPKVYLSDDVIGRFIASTIQKPNNTIAKSINKCAKLIGSRLPIKYTEDIDYTKYIKNINKMGLIILDGYWQSAEMVNAVKDEIKDIILQKQITSKDYTDIARRIDGQNNSVAVHIRDFWLEDQVTQSLSKGKENYLQQTLSKKYYQKAVSKVLEHNEEAFFFIFANDNSKAHKMLEGILPRDKYLLAPNAEDAQKDYEALILMSRCKHFIMSNSTFGWWGAWLSWAKGQDSPRDAIYCMPSHWDRGDQAEQLSRSFKFSAQCLLITDLAK